MDNIKNTAKFSSKTKKIILLVLLSIPFLLGLIGSILHPKIAYADSIDNIDAPYITKYHPLGNATIIFKDWGRTFYTFNPTQHDYPRSIGGLMGVDELGNIDMLEDTYVRAVHNKVTDDNGVNVSLGIHTYYQNGSETITFNNKIYSSVQPMEHRNIETNGANAFGIATNLILKEDCNALRRYQFELPKNMYKIKLTGQLLYKSGLKTLSFTTPLISNDYYNYASYFPFIETKNTKFARVNIGQLLSELTGEVFDSRRNEFQCINNLAIEFIAYKYPTNSTTATIYTKMYLNDLRGYTSAINEYNSLMYQYQDNPTLSLFAPVNAFLNLEIFNGFTMGYLLLICIGFSLFTLLAKVLHNS